MLAIADRLDHLVYATPDLDATVRDVAQVLGVTPSGGGRHPAWGTWNALLSLGPRTYLEIVAPDLDQPHPARPRPFALDNLDRPRLVTWACRTSRLDDVVDRARRVGVDLGEVRPGSRLRPDGSTLSWRMTDPTAPREEGLVPFFIDWGDSDHPATRAPIGCSLDALRLVHPEPERLGSILASLGLDIPVYPGKRPGLAARITGPNATIDLSSEG